MIARPMVAELVLNCPRRRLRIPSISGYKHARLWTLALLSVALAPLSLSQPFLFPVGGPYFAFPNERPSAVASGDFDRDGKLEFVVTNVGTRTITMLATTGEETSFPGFVRLGTRAVGGTPTALVTADFNRDGVSDVAVAHDAGVAVFLGDGFGNLSAPAQFVVGNSVAISAADIDGDGKSDLVVSRADGAVTFLQGGANGSFAWNGSAHLVAGGTQSVGASDFDRDGKLDIVIARRDANKVTLFAGLGATFLGVEAGSASAIAPDALAVADLNGDARPDIVALSSGNGSASVLLTNMDGTFSAPVAYATGSGASAALVTDINRDGKLDVIVANRTANTLSVLFGFGDGRLADAVNFASDPSPTAVIATTLYAGTSSARRPGVVTVSSGRVQRFVYGGGFCGAFSPMFSQEQPAIVSESLEGFVSADFNRDGRLDFATIGTSRVLSVALGVGRGTFTPPATIASCCVTPQVMSSGDFNGDGVPDLAIAGGAYFATLVGRGDGSFEDGIRFDMGGISARAVSAGDFNSDGRLDAAVATDAGVSVLINQGPSGFVTGSGRQLPFFTPTLYNAVGSRNLRVLALADFNRDGRLDIAAGTESRGDVQFLRGNGNGSFEYGALVLTVFGGTSVLSLSAADFDGDGAIDLAVDCANAFISRGRSTDVFFGAGDGTFPTQRGINSGFEGPLLAIGDLNFDGRTDLIMGIMGSPALTSVYDDGSRTFARNVNAGCCMAPSGTAVGLLADPDLDGEVDLVVAGSSGLKVLLSDSNCFPTLVPKTTTVQQGRSFTGVVATVLDAETPAGMLAVTVGSVPDGITIAIDGNDAGAVSATVTAACGATPGLKRIPLRVDNILGYELTVTVSADAAPNPGSYASLTGPQALGPGSDSVVLKLTSANDPEAQSVSYSMARPAGYAGGLSVDAATGQVGLTNAGPPGRYEFVVTVTDTPCSKQATTKFTVEVSATFTEPPQNFRATAITTTTVRLDWLPVTNANRYAIERRPNVGAMWQLVTDTLTASPFDDTARQPDTAYLYRIRAFNDAFGSAGPYTGNEAAVTILFTDDPLMADVSQPKAVHFTELRSAINAVRTAAGLAPVSFTGNVVQGSVISASHVAELRSALSPAFTAIYGGSPALTDPTTGPGTPIRAAHVQDLRTAVK